MVQPLEITMEKLAVSYKINILLHYDSAVLYRDIYKRNENMYPQKDIHECSLQFLITIAKT